MVTMNSAGDSSLTMNSAGESTLTMNSAGDSTLTIAAGSINSGMNHLTHSEEEDQCPSTPNSPGYDGGDLMTAAMGDEVTAQLAAAGWQKDHGDWNFALFFFIS